MESLNKVLQLRSDAGKILDELEVMQDNAQTEGRDLNAAEYKIYYSKLDDVHKIKRQEEKIIKEHCLQDELDQLSSGPVERSNPLSGGSYSTATRAAGGRDYRSMFGEPKGNGGFNTFNDYLTAVSSNQTDSRLNEMRFMETGLPSAGGFMVPEQWAQVILDKSLEGEIIRPLARIWPMQTETLNIPVWNSYNHSGGEVFGGLSGQWLAEGGAAVNEDPQLRQLTLKAKKLAVYCQASREMVQSGINFEQQLADAMFKAVGWHLDDAFITGLGVGRPLGVISSPGVVTVDPEPGQVGEILYQNLAKMFSRLHPSLIKNSYWLANSTIIPELLQLSHPVGVGGSHIPVMTEGSSGQFKVLSRPVIFTEKLPAMGTRGDVVLFAPSEYAVGLRQELMIDRSSAPGWQNDLESYRVIVRADGQGSWPDVFTPKAGLTQGWAVVLADR